MNIKEHTLEATPIQYEDCIGDLHDAVIVMDYDIGFTIKDKHTGQYLQCASGPSSPMWRDYDGAIEQHDALYAAVVAQVKTGVVSVRGQDAATGRLAGGGLPGPDVCSFNQ